MVEIYSSFCFYLQLPNMTSYLNSNITKFPVNISKVVPENQWFLIAEKSKISHGFLEELISVNWILSRTHGIYVLSAFSRSSSWIVAFLPGSDGATAACGWASPTMPLVVDAVWALWSITAGIYDYFHTSAMEERIHTLEHVLSIHQFVIAGLSAGLVLLMAYILLRKH